MKTRTISIPTLSLLASLAFASGCVTEDEQPPLVDDQLETATTEQEVSGTSLKWHSCTTQDCTVSLGASTDRTCVLAGLRGKLASGISGYPAGANIVNNGSWGWILYIHNPSYEDISVRSLCINNTANRVTASWQSGTPATLIPPGPSSTRRCFLGGIWNYNSTAFSGFSSNTRVWRDGNSHFIGGTLPNGSNARVFATCVDVATNQGEYAYGNGTANEYIGNLAYNPASGGVACGMTGIGGKFTTNNLGSEATISYNSGTRYWIWGLSPWTGAWALCVK